MLFLLKFFFEYKKKGKFLVIIGVNILLKCKRGLNLIVWFWFVIVIMYFEKLIFFWFIVLLISFLMGVIIKVLILFVYWVEFELWKFFFLNEYIWFVFIKRYFLFLCVWIILKFVILNMLWFLNR